MKNLKTLIFTTAAIAASLTFSACGNSEQPVTLSPNVEEGVKGIKIAFVDIDSLLSNYNLSTAINKEMLRKEENMRMTLSKKARDIQNDIDDFQQKLENNVYATQKRAEEEQNRIIKRREDYERMQERLANELAAESQKNNIILRDSINSFLADFNKVHGFDLIISRVGDNLLYANSALDITEAVIKGLNERYKGEEN